MSKFTPNYVLRACAALAAVAIASTAAHAATRCVNPGGTAGCWSTISAAVAASTNGDIVQVAAGTYNEQVTITKSISLVGTSAVINANGLPRGIFVNGMATAPGAGLPNIVISGFEVRGANFEGILVANTSNVTIMDNHVHNNNKGLTAGTCPNIDSFETNEGQDCGEGIHLMGSNHAFLLRNLVEYNSGGILITDETGITYSNVVRANTVRNNAYACGITMASHPPATSVIPSAKGPFGISENVISHNASYSNGLGAPGAGAGVGIFAPGPGSTNTHNLVIGNDLHNNGLPGVTMHNHAAFPSPAPPVNLNSNTIIGNNIYGNAADTFDAFTPGSTGINIYSVAPITGTIIADNIFNNESIDIAFNAPSGQLDVHMNDFNGQEIGIDNIGTGNVDATQNWWNCPSGPSVSCSTTNGPHISTAPWLGAAAQ